MLSLVTNVKQNVDLIKLGNVYLSEYEHLHVTRFFNRG